MNLTVNGEARSVPDGATIDDVLATLAIRREGVAVALNDDVIPRTQHAARRVHDGDALEIIVAVAGG